MGLTGPSPAIAAAAASPPIWPSARDWLVRSTFILGSGLLLHLKSTTMLTASSDVPWDVAVAVTLLFPCSMLALMARGRSTVPLSQKLLNSVVGLLIVLTIFGALVGWWAYMATDYAVEALAFRSQASVRGDGWYPILANSSWHDRDGESYHIVGIDPYRTGKLKKFKVGPLDGQVIADRNTSGYQLHDLCLQLPVEQSGSAARALVKQRDRLRSGSVAPCPTSDPQGSADLQPSD